jgi:hypothetical protein
MMPTTAVPLLIRHTHGDDATTALEADGEGLRYFQLLHRPQGGGQQPQQQGPVQPTEGGVVELRPQPPSARERVELSASEFFAMLDLTAGGSGALDSQSWTEPASRGTPSRPGEVGATAAGGCHYSLLMQGRVFDEHSGSDATGVVGFGFGRAADRYLRERLTLIDTRGDGDIRTTTMAAAAAAADIIKEQPEPEASEATKQRRRQEQQEEEEEEEEAFDAVVCVLDAQRIGSADDARHLAAAAARGAQLFVVVNKSELLDADLAEEDDDDEEEQDDEEQREGAPEAEGSPSAGIMFGPDRVDAERALRSMLQRCGLPSPPLVRASARRHTAGTGPQPEPEPEHGGPAQPAAAAESGRFTTTHFISARSSAATLRKMGRGSSEEVLSQGGNAKPRRQRRRRRRWQRRQQHWLDAMAAFHASLREALGVAIRGRAQELGRCLDSAGPEQLEQRLGAVRGIDYQRRYIDMQQQQQQ